MIGHGQPGYLIGIDLAKRRDYTALAVVHRTPAPVASIGADRTRYHYGLVHLERWNDKPYRAVVAVAERVLRRLGEAANEEAMERTGRGITTLPEIPILVDYTGVGLAVVNDIIRPAGLSCHGVMIHGGNAVSRSKRDYQVPKRELVATLQVLIEERRLAYPDPSDLPAVTNLIDEMDTFQAETKLAMGQDAYGAGADWREGKHDDLVLATAMACWYGEYLDAHTPVIRSPTGALRAYLDMQ